MAPPRKKRGSGTALVDTEELDSPGQLRRKDAAKTAVAQRKQVAKTGDLRQENDRPSVGMRMWNATRSQSAKGLCKGLRGVFPRGAAFLTLLIFLGIEAKPYWDPKAKAVVVPGLTVALAQLGCKRVKQAVGQLYTFFDVSREALFGKNWAILFSCLVMGKQITPDLVEWQLNQSAYADIPEGLKLRIVEVVTTALFMFNTDFSNLLDSIAARRLNGNIDALLAEMEHKSTLRIHDGIDRENPTEEDFEAAEALLERRG